MPNYEIWLATDRGARIALLDEVIQFDYVMTVNEIGACSLLLPGNFDRNLLQCDRQIQINRAPTGRSLQPERTYLIQTIVERTDSSGVRSLQVIGLDGVQLLVRRIIAYAAESANSKKTDQADDMMKVIVRENLGASATDIDRRFNATYFSVAADDSLGPSISKAFAWRNVLTVAQDIADAAREAGTEVYFDVVKVSDVQWQFQTFITQRGLDRTFSTGINPMILGLEFGNLAEPELSNDWSNEATVVYGLGQGEGADRVTVEVEDAARSGRSIFGRREDSQDARRETATAAVTAAANAQLTAARPRLRFTARVLDVESARYGLDWHWGDRVTAIYNSRNYDAHIRSVHIQVDTSGRESIDARLEVYE